MQVGKLPMKGQIVSSANVLGHIHSLLQLVSSADVAPNKP